MARETRLDHPGALHHVIARGIRGEAIFRDDLDRDDYLDRLARIAEQNRLAILGWALMPNHVHLIARTGAVPLASSMQRIGTGYARSLNARYERVGYVFQGRYKSIRIEEEEYLRVLLRYVHRNPLVGGLVSDDRALEAYPWTGHGALMGRALDRFGAASEILSLFGSTPAAARKRLRVWMSSDRESDTAPGGCGDRVCVSGPPIHRDATVVASPRLAASALDDLQADRRARQLALRSRWRIADVVDHVCGTLDVEPATVRSGSRIRRVCEARAAIAFLAHEQLGLPLTRLAGALGVSSAALGRALLRGEHAARRAGLDLDGSRQVARDTPGAANNPERSIG